MNCFRRVIPTLKHYCDVASDIPSGSICSISILTLYLTFFLAYILIIHPTFDLASYSDKLCGIYSDSLSGILYGIYSDILSGIFSLIHSGILSDTWHSIWYIHVYPRRFFVVAVRQATLCSGARGWGPAGNTLIRSLRLRSGRGRRKAGRLR